MRGWGWSACPCCPAVPSVVLSAAVYQGLIRTCSHQVVLDTVSCCRAVTLVDKDLVILCGVVWRTED